VVGKKDKGNTLSVCFHIVVGRRGKTFISVLVYHLSIEMKGTKTSKHLFEMIVFVIQASLIGLQSKVLLLFPITSAI